MAMVSQHTERAKRPAQWYDRLEESQRVHLILRPEKTNDEIGAQVQDSALPDLMENVSEAFAIYWQHMVVTVDSTSTFDATVHSTGSDPGREYQGQELETRRSLPLDWVVEETAEQRSP
jgi:hypothetical protein